MHYLLFYDVVDDYVSRRVPFRAAHIALAREAVARGDLVLGGALADPADGAVLLFRGSSPSVAESFARKDPYVTNGLVTKWYVREWTRNLLTSRRLHFRRDDGIVVARGRDVPPNDRGRVPDR